MKSDIPARLNYLVSQEGGVRAAARRANIPYTTFRRLLKGENEPTQANRNRINRAFRRLAPDEVKRREKRGRGAGVALVDEATARKLAASYDRQGISYRVYGRIEFKVDDNGTIIKKTSYGQGADVDTAKRTMFENFATYGESYPSIFITEVEDPLYRVVPNSWWPA